MTALPVCPHCGRNPATAVTPARGLPLRHRPELEKLINRITAEIQR